MADAAGPGIWALDGVSCFESLRVYRGVFFRLREHAARLEESCRGLGRTPPFAPKALEAWLADGLAGSGFSEALVRVSFLFGCFGIGGGEKGEAAAIFREFHGHPPAWYRQGVSVRTAVVRRAHPGSQDAALKTSQFLTGVLAHLETGGGNAAHEILFLGPSGAVAEGTVSNIFLVRGKRLLTPSGASGILKGITRGVVMELARRRGMPVEETVLTRHDVYGAEECFLTNTSSEILSVVRADGRRIGAGKPGPWAQALAADFKRLVHQETGKKKR